VHVLRSVHVLANAIFIIPFLLFSGLAGQIADKYKSTIVICVKAAEIAIVILAIYRFQQY
ncbi:MAG UNVERIFIED_CONTAM: hypothetical protein LVQ98_05995, partial [Rickettsiaceae bacterium]